MRTRFRPKQRNARQIRELLAYTTFAGKFYGAHGAPYLGRVERLSPTLIPSANIQNGG